MSTIEEETEEGGELGPQVLPLELKDELENSFMQYAMSVIMGRALPDVRDGMKPVHRRILYAMFALGLTPESGYRKCARVVGEVLGKFHPHGDSSVYEALVRMAQDFVMSAPLVAGHGNFGSVDNDPPAAMRYTECRLSGVARDALMTDLGQDTVPMVPNFDGNEQEPAVLPARLPMLLLNGAAGIAVGMATNIPPHNLGELVDGCVALLGDRDLPDAELYRLIPAPDFPTGGHLLGTEGARRFYETGNGGIQIRAVTNMEMITNGRMSRNAIIVTELPYQVSKAGLLAKIAEMVNDKKLDGISDLRDESNRDGIRVVLELKRDANPSVVRNNLFKKTQLQASFAGNHLALGAAGKQPHRYSLRQALLEFLDFRFETVRKRAAFDLGKVQARQHLLEGLLLALGRIDDIIDLMRKSKDTASARKKLMGKEYGLTEVQANAILGLTLSRLTGMEEKKLKSEQKDLASKNKELTQLMEDDSKVKAVMVEEMLALKNKYAVPRRSIIIKDEGELSAESLIENLQSIIMITHSGYIKRMPLDQFESQNRGTRGKAGAKLGEGDRVKFLFTVNDHDTVLFISEKGVAYAVRAFEVPVGSRVAKGVPLPQVVPINNQESIQGVIPVSSFPDDEFLVLLTKDGWIKRTALSAFQKVTARGLTCISLGDGDRLRHVGRCRDSQTVIIGTQNGFATRFHMSKLRASGRSSRGVKSMNLRDGDRPVDMDILPDPDTEADDQQLLLLTRSGLGKRVAATEFRIQGRGGMGVIATKFKARQTDDKLACLRVVSDNDEIVLSTKGGNIVRQRAADISIQGRAATGVVVQKLVKGDEIVNVAVVPEKFQEEDDGEVGEEE